MPRFADLLVEVSIDLDEKYKTKGSLGKWLRQKWVDISRKDPTTGKHPPCGASAGKGERGPSGSRKYPKCRPARSAASMSKGEKRSAIVRKRKAGNPGGKPTMVSTHKKEE